MILRCGFSRLWLPASSQRPPQEAVGAHSSCITRRARNLGEDPCEGEMQENMDIFQMSSSRYCWGPFILHNKQGKKLPRGGKLQ